MKMLSATLMTLACFGASAVQADVTTENSFSCMSETTFEINANCMSNTIEASDSFLSAQSMLLERSANGEHAMATLTIDPKTLNIEVVAHKDAYLAKLLNKNN
jgi:hypothetical protein